MRFTHQNWREMLAHIQGIGVHLTGVSGFLKTATAGTSSAGRVVLRHDVDRLAQRAVAMARIETSLGLRSTYYVRCTREGTFDSRSISAISDLGHEVGYHYENLSRCHGRRDDALSQFERCLTELRKIVPCETVAMHGAPFSAHDNQKLLDGMELSRFGLIGDAVRHMEPYDPLYVTDTGGGWNATGRSNRRDRVGRTDPIAAIYPRPDRAFAAEVSRLGRPLYINTHPERWAAGRIDGAQIWITDSLVNLAKQFSPAPPSRSSASD